MNDTTKWYLCYCCKACGETFYATTRPEHEARAILREAAGSQNYRYWEHEGCRKENSQYIGRGELIGISRVPAAGEVQV